MHSEIIIQELNKIGVIVTEENDHGLKIYTCKTDKYICTYIDASYGLTASITNRSDCSTPDTIKWIVDTLSS